ncbi:DUF4232 domain-containing protein [Streptomyces termitum]|uniref:DUF4232 domain-containing protein n=1 Tax=Streptomyces termitum TaxID=67368 RepID=A0A918SXV3_9ACTN|nr:DUF4232 domain-containing protein [Streptomyces termitum]GHA72514.1 hypothetical protein GCM10010305_13480 [Streptomyces termitum]
MRTLHKKTAATRAALLAAVAVASLGLTACGGGDAVKDAGAAKPAQQTTAPQTTGEAPAGEAETGSTGSTGSSDTTGSTGSTGSTGTTGTKTKAKTGTDSGPSSSGTKAKAKACAYGDVKVTMEKADEVPTEHIVLTATNTSGRTCTLLKYPLISFGQLQTAKDVPPVAKSNPGIPIVLDAGASAYANVRVSQGGVHEDNKVVQEFGVNLFAADGPAEGTVTVKTPAGGLAVTDAAAKTGYWTYELRNGADEF